MTSPDIHTLAEEMRARAEAATPGPWFVRPDKHDDWGFVRPAPNTEGRGLVASVRGGHYFPTEEQFSEHRRLGTDPYGANAAHIAASSPTNVLAILDALAARDAEIAKLKAAGTRVDGLREAAEIVRDKADQHAAYSEVPAHKRDAACLYETERAILAALSTQAEGGER